MGIFDGDVKRINEENRKKADDENKRLRNEAENKKVALHYILVCINEFPSATKNVNLRTRTTNKRGYLIFKSFDFNIKIDVWEVSHGLFIALNGRCYIYTWNGCHAVPVSNGKFAEAVYDVIRYKLSSSPDNIQAIVENSFVGVLSGRSLK